MRIKSDRGTRDFRTSEEAAEWLLENRPETVSVDGVDISDECDWTEYGVTLGVIDFALEFGNED